MGKTRMRTTHSMGKEWKARPSETLEGGSEKSVARSTISQFYKIHKEPILLSRGQLAAHLIFNKKHTALENHMK